MHYSIPDHALIVAGVCWIHAFWPQLPLVRAALQHDGVHPLLKQEHAVSGSSLHKACACMCKCATLTLYAWVCWLQGSTIGFMLFHLQYTANVPDMYFDIPRSQHDKDLAALMGAAGSPPCMQHMLPCGFRNKLRLHDCCACPLFCKALTNLKSALGPALPIMPPQQ